jgi:hypothetical protein
MGNSLPYAPLVVANPVIPNPGSPNSRAVAGGTGPSLAAFIPWQHDFSDQSIVGAVKINPAAAATFFAGRYNAQHPNGGDNEPPIVNNRLTTQTLATGNSPNAWKKRTAPASSAAVQFGTGKPQAPVARPWIKQFIPPLALYNDASQWVNRLMFNRPGDRHGNGNSDPPQPVRIGSLPSTPPATANNIAAGAMNIQLQLGQMTNMAANLTLDASNYFGGS